MRPRSTGSQRPTQAPRPAPSRALSSSLPADEKGTCVRAAPLILMLLVAAAGSTRPAAAQGQPPSANRGQSSRTSSQGPQTSLPISTFLGGVPTGTATDRVETLTLVGVITRALEHNLGILTAEQRLGHAQGARWRALSEMLPDINGRISETRQQINLQAFGF